MAENKSLVEQLAGLSEAERKAFILSIMSTPEFAEVKKDKAAVDAAEKQAAEARRVQQEAARAEIVKGLFDPLSAVVMPLKDKMVAAGLSGVEVTVSADGVLGVKPIVKGGAARSASGSRTASGGSASATSVRSTLGRTPESLFEEFATEAEKEYYKAISPLSSEAYNFRRAVYVPRGIEAGVLDRDAKKADGKPMWTYNKAMAEAWAKDPINGRFSEKETFEQVRRRAEAVKAEKEAK
jgi:hypothetical protein